jgi:hypothetical protein
MFHCTGRGTIVMDKIRGFIAMGVMVLVGMPVGAAAQERGTITGTVVEQATQRPLSGAQVQVAGTNLGTLTNQQGRYLIANVPAGPGRARALELLHRAGGCPGAKRLARQLPPAGHQRGDRRVGQLLRLRGRDRRLRPGRRLAAGVEPAA